MYLDFNYNLHKIWLKFKKLLESSKYDFVYKPNK